MHITQCNEYIYDEIYSINRFRFEIYKQTISA